MEQGSGVITESVLAATQEKLSSGNTETKKYLTCSHYQAFDSFDAGVFEVR